MQVHFNWLSVGCIHCSGLGPIIKHCLIICGPARYDLIDIKTVRLFLATMVCFLRNILAQLKALNGSCGLISFSCFLVYA